ncbi:MAG: hypothetical protein HY395_02855 [Candidatus Doudnabacteria bacterium]|nr:hypothetical protein [Candidatus Doudnabacteria bacterium]
MILLSLGAGIVLMVGKKKSETVEQTEAQPEVRKLVDEAVISPISSFDGSAIWYFNASGQLFRVMLDGSGLTEFPLPALTTGSLIQALWPQQGNDFIITTITSIGEVKYHYDNDQKKYVQLPEAVQSLDWMPDGERILYVWKAGDNTQQLKIAVPDSSGFSTIAELFWLDYVVKVSPTGDRALVYRSKPTQELNKIYQVDIESGKFDPVVEEGKNIGAVWVPGGEKFIFAQERALGATRLLMYNFSNRQVTDLDLATSIDKISVDPTGKTLYAAAGKSGIPGEEFVKLDLLTFNQETYYQPEQDTKVKSLLEIKGKLYFVNLFDNKLYYIAK